MNNVFSINKLSSKLFSKVSTVEVGEISKANCVVPRPVTRYSTYHRPKVFKLLILALTTLGVSFLTPSAAEAQSDSTSSSGEAVRWAGFPTCRRRRRLPAG